LPAIITAIIDLLWVITASAIGTQLLLLGASIAVGEISKLFRHGPSASSLLSQMSSRCVIAVGADVDLDEPSEQQK